jgi:hypothetical protein
MGNQMAAISTSEDREYFALDGKPKEKWEKGGKKVLPKPVLKTIRPKDLRAVTTLYFSHTRADGKQYMTNMKLRSSYHRDDGYVEYVVPDQCAMCDRLSVSVNSFHAYQWMHNVDAYDLEKVPTLDDNDRGCMLMLAVDAEEDNNGNVWQRTLLYPSIELAVRVTLFFKYVCTVRDDRDRPLTVMSVAIKIYKIAADTVVNYDTGCE